jgi:hypothetical protein
MSIGSQAVAQPNGSVVQRLSVLQRHLCQPPPSSTAIAASKALGASTVYEPEAAANFVADSRVFDVPRPKVRGSVHVHVAQDRDLGETG